MSVEAPMDVSSEFKNFFNTLYGVDPIAESVRRNTQYSVPGQGVTVVTDPYGGCHVNVNFLDEDQMARAKEALSNLTEEFQATRAFDSVWIDMSTPFSLSAMGRIAPDSFQIGVPFGGDLIYDYQEKKIKTWKWLNPDKECTIPPAATHNIGASALVIDSVANKVLLVVNVRRDNAWNLPGGSYDTLDSTPIVTAIREAQEEGGFIVNPEEIGEPVLMGQSQFPTNQFAPAINQIWAFFIDGVSERLLNPPPAEIKTAEWLDVDSVLSCEGELGGLKVGPEVTETLAAAVQGLGSVKVLDKGWMVVHAPVHRDASSDVKSTDI